MFVMLHGHEVVKLWIVAHPDHASDPLVCIWDDCMEDHESNADDLNLDMIMQLIFCARYP